MPPPSATATTTSTSTNKAGAVSRNLARLVALLVPASNNSNSNNNNAAIRSAATAAAERILNSRIASTVAADDSQAADAIKKKLIKKDPSMQQALVFSNLNQRLASMNILNRKWAVLHFLLTVSDQSSFKNQADMFIDNAFAVMGIKSIKAAPQFPTLPQAFPPAAEINNDTTDSDSVLKKPRGPCNGYYLLGGSNDNAKLQITEPLLLRDVMFMFQDIDGRYIKYNASLDAFVVHSDVWIPAPTLETIHRLSEVGWLYRRIKKRIDSWTCENRADGLVRQGFCVGVQKELTAHFHLIAQLEDQFTKADQAGTSDFASKGLSLKRLLVWIHEPLLKLRLVSVLVDSSEGLRGGALLSMIHGYTNHGDPFVKQFVEGLLKEISVPFYQMLKRWLYEGELNDPFNEFFVVQDRNVDESNMWRNQYLLRQEMIPSFFHRGVAKKCFLIGKSLNFIRYCCGEETFVIKRSQELVSSPPGFLEYGDSSALEKSITTAYTSISAHILDLLFGKYKLMTHLQALKKYLLLGQGDFVQNLMDKLGADLSKPAHGILRHNLTGILESSIRASNAQHDDMDVLRRLDVRLLEISAGDSGWDVFTLDYHTDSPISTVFPAQSMHQYMKLFTFLWRLKRVEHSLSVAWRRGMTEYTAFRKMKDVGQHFHFCSVVLSEMIHFTYQLQYYILFEVLESSWNELNEYLGKRTGDLDQLIGAHNKYLNNITSRGLLAASVGENQNMFSMLIGLFDVIFKFQHAMEELVEIGIEMAKVAKQSDVKAYEARLLNRIASAHDTRLNVSEKSSGTLTERADRAGIALRTIAEEYHSDLQTMLNALSSHPDVNLHGLRIRLDYNAFYKAKAA